MPWKPMKKHVRPLGDEATVAIGSGGAIYLNAFAMVNYFKSVPAVIILHDAEAKRLGIKPAKLNEEDAFRLAFSNRTASTGVIAARSVVKQLKLNYQENTLFYTGVWNPELGVLEIDLTSYRAKPRRLR